MAILMDVTAETVLLIHAEAVDLRRQTRRRAVSVLADLIDPLELMAVGCQNTVRRV